MDEVDFYVGSRPGHLLGHCVTALATGISGADVQPNAPSFDQRCAFCAHHPWACISGQPTV
eukprot:582705-Amphidinium_carterae.1